ncbi:MAG: hypothetical protein ACI4QV_00860 [Acutalibacteraceae bacterium]
MSKLFEKHAKACGICSFGIQDENNRVVYCKKRGVMDYGDCCRKFKYDPLARVPKIQKPLPAYTKEDFDINR